MGKKYPKFQWEYEDDEWRELADRQARLINSAKIISVLAVVGLVLWHFN